MKRAIPKILFVALALVWNGCAKHETGDPTAAAESKPAADEEEGATVSRDEEGNAVIHMTDEMQGDIGLLVAHPVAAQIAPERKAYGKVLEAAPLITSLADLATAEAALTASSNELARLKILAPQGNASVRALESAQAATTRDQLMVQTARDHLAISWGQMISQQSNVSELVQSLLTREAVLIRLDLPAGESLSTTPESARIITLSDQSTDARLLGPAASVDPQMQGQGFVALVQPNPLQLLPGQAVTGYLKLPGNPIPAVIIPRDAIVRTAGSAWIYVVNQDGESFTRREIVLDHSDPTGWAVTNGVTVDNHIVTIGAQTLLSQELKASIQAD